MALIRLFTNEFFPNELFPNTYFPKSWQAWIEDPRVRPR